MPLTEYELAQRRRTLAEKRAQKQAEREQRRLERRARNEIRRFAQQEPQRAGDLLRSWEKWNAQQSQPLWR